MSGNRTRGLLRAAALLAVGASPLIASAANAAEAPIDIVDGTIGHAPEVGVDAARPATDLLSGQALKLPAPMPGAAPEVQAPKVAAPAAVKVPTAPRLPMVGDVLAEKARTVDPALPLPALPPLPGTPALPTVDQLPVQAPTLG